MPKDLVVLGDDRPAVLSRLSTACEQAGVAIEGVCAFVGEGMGTVHLLVADDAVPLALAALGGAGLEVRAARDVLLVECEDVPHALGEVFGRLDDARIQVQEAYLASSSRLVVVVDDPAAADVALQR